MEQMSMHLTSTCSAPPDVVYDFLADLRTHTTWAGTQQTSDFRLLTLEAPPGLASAGTAFSSTGTMPMSSRRWQDRSQVTAAERPNIFEFVTTATARSMKATYRHRYEIAATPEGSKVSYSMTQLAISNPLLRLGLPVVKNLTWRFGIPFMAGRGFRNLLSNAEQRARSESLPRAQASRV
jgi:Polyketide cyclase / dehydrase and lipid transport